MKRKITIASLWLVASMLCSCVHDMEIDHDSYVDNSNRVRFTAVSGSNAGAVNTKASDVVDTTDLLQPLVLRNAGVDFPLYLHTYVGDVEEETAPVTKGLQTNDIGGFVALNKDGFKVVSHYVNDNKEIFIPMSLVKPTTNAAEERIWNTDKQYYWPNNSRNLAFFAYAPEAKVDLLKEFSHNVDNRSMSFNYTVPVGKGDMKDRDAEVQPDLMFAITECNKATSYKNMVPLNFRHALSAIKFKVRDVVGGTIESISISGVYGSGHCDYVWTYNENVPAEYNKEVPAVNSVANNSVFTWSGYDETKCRYTQTFGFKTTDNPIRDESEDVKINDSMPEKTFLLLPQELTDDATIEIVFKRDSDGPDGEPFILSGKIKDNNVTKWEPGKEYYYTISTSSSNWTYVFDVIGCVQDKKDADPENGDFHDDPNNIIVNHTNLNGAYYKVRSYRERANGKGIKEAVPWSARLSEGRTRFPEELVAKMHELNIDETKIHDISIKSSKWIPDAVLSGKGGAEFETVFVTFYRQMTGTDWNGDWDLRTRDSLGTRDNYIDLSTVNGPRSTANCYVVNAPGYYKFPLVYGNAITNNNPTQSSWKYKPNGTPENAKWYPALTEFEDYQGNKITQPYISGAVSAQLLWADAYNLVSDVQLNANKNTVSFKVNRDNLQQGNVVIGILDSQGKIMWSWHIWITEHWTNKGDLKIGVDDVEYNDVNGKGLFVSAPYNLGWCDAKNVWYILRDGNMRFAQEYKGEVKATHDLYVQQREHKIEYWIGNNTYYQFGRKDPIVGFMNFDSIVKYNFGTYTYKLESQVSPKTIQDGIQNPNVLYVGAPFLSGLEPKAENYKYNDWLGSTTNNHYHNLWNNAEVTLPVWVDADAKKGIEQHTQRVDIELIDYHYSGVKTVYDPSPAGYMVPPVGYFMNIVKGGNVVTDGDFLGTFEKIKDADPVNNLPYDICNYKSVGANGKIQNFNVSGHRWYADKLADPGSNFNPNYVYMWANQIIFSTENFSAYGLWLGPDAPRTYLDENKVEQYYKDNAGNIIIYTTNNSYCFSGRRSMARPVRPIKIGTNSNIPNKY